MLTETVLRKIYAHRDYDIFALGIMDNKTMKYIRRSNSATWGGVTNECLTGSLFWKLLRKKTAINTRGAEKVL